MKKTGRFLGHVEVRYYLGSVFDRAFQDFEKADTEAERINKEFKRTHGENLIPPLMAATNQRILAGVVTLFAAGAWLEQMIYGYAVTFIDPNYYEEHYDRLQLLTRWVLMPSLCQGKEIDEDGAEINNLRELIKARNAVVHPKLRIIGRTVDDFEQANRLTDREAARFLNACRKASLTVHSLKNLLEKPIPRAT